MDRTEQAGLGVAILGHAALLALLAFGLFKPEKLPPPPPDGIDVTLVGETPPAMTALPAPEPPAEQPTETVPTEPSENDRQAEAEAQKAEAAKVEAAAARAAEERAAAAEREARKNKDAEALRIAEEKRRIAEAERRKKEAEAERKRKEAEDSRKKAEAERKRKAEADRKRKEEADRRRKELERIRREQQAQIDAQRKQEEENRRLAYEAGKAEAMRKVNVSLVQPLYRTFLACLPAGARSGSGYEDIITKIVLNLRPNGSLEDVIFNGQSGVSGANGDKATRLKECAMQAARDAAPFGNLPKDYYDLWKRWPMRLKTK